MSFTLHGLGVSAGIAIGRAHLISQATLEVAHLTLAPRQVDKEIARFDAAVDAVRTEFLALKENAEHAPPELSAFIDVHLMFLADSELSAKPREIIRERRCNRLLEGFALRREQHDASSVRVFFANGCSKQFGDRGEDRFRF